MRKPVIGICVLLLAVIATVLALVSSEDESENTSHQTPNYLGHSDSRLKRQDTTEDLALSIMAKRIEALESRKDKPAENTDGNLQGSEADNFHEIDIVERKAEELKRVIDIEPIDRNWADERESFLLSKINPDSFPGTRVLSVSCRTSLCQLELEHENNANQQKFIAEFPYVGADGADAWWMKTQETDDDYSTLYFVTREAGTGLF